jgi:hypothetical protein
LGQCLASPAIPVPAAQRRFARLAKSGDAVLTIVPHRRNPAQSAVLQPPGADRRPGRQSQAGFLRRRVHPRPKIRVRQSFLGSYFGLRMATVVPSVKKKTPVPLSAAFSAALGPRRAPAGPVDQEEERKGPPRSGIRARLVASSASLFRAEQAILPNLSPRGRGRTTARVSPDRQWHQFPPRCGARAFQVVCCPVA